MEKKVVLSRRHALLGRGLVIVGGVVLFLGTAGSRRELRAPAGSHHLHAFEASHRSERWKYRLVTNRHSGVPMSCRAVMSSFLNPLAVGCCRTRRRWGSRGMRLCWHQTRRRPPPCANSD